MHEGTDPRVRPSRLRIHADFCCPRRRRLSSGRRPYAIRVPYDRRCCTRRAEEPDSVSVIFGTATCVRRWTPGQALPTRQHFLLPASAQTFYVIRARRFVMTLWPKVSPSLLDAIAVSSDRRTTQGGFRRCPHADRASRPSRESLGPCECISALLNDPYRASGWPGRPRRAQRLFRAERMTRRRWLYHRARRAPGPGGQTASVQASPFCALSRLIRHAEMHSETSYFTGSSGSSSRSGR